MEEQARQFSPSLYDYRPDAGRFTMREAICHLADWEPILLERLKTAVESPGSRLTVYDEGERAIEMNYAAKNPMDALEEWKRERAKTIEFIMSMKEDDFAKTVLHPERGVMSAGDLANMIPCHDVYHIEQLSAIRGAAKTIDTW